MIGSGIGNGGFGYRAFVLQELKDGRIGEVFGKRRRV